jgi:hypothetical protein
MCSYGFTHCLVCDPSSYIFVRVHVLALESGTSNFEQVLRLCRVFARKTSTESLCPSIHPLPKECITTFKVRTGYMFNVPTPPQ